MRIGVIEVGHWHAGGYIHGVRRLGEEIVAVSDRDPETARRTADEIGCRAYASHLDLIEKERPDFVFAHGIHSQMTQIASDLVAYDVPFVMEKPMGVDWQALAAVADSAEGKGLFAGVDLVMRCYSLIHELLCLKDSGQLGQVTSYCHRLLAGEPQRYREWNVPWVLDPAQAGGGPLFNFGPHVIDLFLALSGQDVQSVYCKSSHTLHGLGVEDYASMVVSTSIGTIGTMEVGYVCPDAKYDRSLSLCTDRLFVSVDRFDAGTICFRNGEERNVSKDGAIDYVGETLRRFRAGEPPVATVRDMCRGLRVINAAVESARTGEPVLLDS